MNHSTKDIIIQIDTIRHEWLTPQWRTELFRHAFRVIPFSRIFYPIDGYGIVHHHDKTFHLTRGKMLLIPSFAEVELGCPEHLEKYWSHLNVFLPETQTDLFFLNQECIEIEVKDHKLTSTLFEMIIRNLTENSLSKQFETDAASRLLLSPFLEKLSWSPEGKTLSGWTDLLLFIDRNLSENLTLEKLAQHSGLCSTYLSHLFKKKMKMGLFEYINMHRSFRAMKLIRENRYTMGEICDMVAFSNVSVFSKVFKKQIGLSPMNFKKNILHQK